jgi:hypothetical protein
VSIPDAQDGSQSPAQLDGAVVPDGRLVIPFHSWRLDRRFDGLGLVKEGDKIGLIDKAGHILGGRLFDGIRPAMTGDVSKVLLSTVDLPDCPSRSCLSDAGGRPTVLVAAARLLSSLRNRLAGSALSTLVHISASATFCGWRADFTPALSP